MPKQTRLQDMTRLKIVARDVGNAVLALIILFVWSFFQV